MPSFWRSKPPAGTRLQREHPLARDLILFVPFNEGAGRPQDLISGITGETTIASGIGMSWVPSPQGMAVKHDNSATGFTDSGSITYPNACAPRGQAFTFWVRYYRAGLGANDCRIRTEHPANGGFQFGVDTSNALQLVRAEEAGFTSSASTVPVGWVDIAVAHAVDNTYRYYLNGQDIGGGTSSGTFNVTKRINIGGSSTSAFAPNGSISSQVLIWNRTLSAGEIASLTPDSHTLFEEPFWRRFSRAVKAAQLVGAQPAATGTLTRFKTALRTLTGAQPSGAGILTRRLAAPRTLLGSQPAATGTLVGLAIKARTVLGSPPSSTGLVTRILAALRLLAGAPSAATGTVTRRLAAGRSLTGSQPSPTGIVSRIAQALRPLTGAQPAATGLLTRTSGFARAVTGAQPFSTATLTARIALRRMITGAQPSATGILVRFTTVARALTGSQPSGTSTLTTTLVSGRALAGAQDAPSGQLTSVTGVYHRTCQGVQPAPKGALTAFHQWRMYVVPEHGQGTSPDEYVPGQVFGTVYDYGYDPIASGPPASGYELVTYADPTVLYSDPDVTYQGRIVAATVPHSGRVTYVVKR